jgi:uncharacterized protein YlzI (FlbEa/FlbD family)
MPRFFFHLRNGERLIVDEDVEDFGCRLALCQRKARQPAGPYRAKMFR